MKFSMWLLLVLMLAVLSDSTLAVSIPININTTNSTITISYETSTTTINFTPDLNTTVQINYVNSSCIVYNHTSVVNIDYELIKTKTVCSLNYSLSCPEPSCPQASCPACPACPNIDYATIDGNVQMQMANFSNQIEKRLSEVNQSLATSLASKSLKIPSLSSLFPFILVAGVIAFATRKQWMPLVGKLNKGTESPKASENGGKKEENPR